MAWHQRQESQLSCLNLCSRFKVTTLLFEELGFLIIMPSQLTGKIFFFYAFPTFSLIGRYQGKIQTNRAEGILIVLY